MKGGCTQLYPEPECDDDIDCNDGDACTSAVCVDKLCVNELLPCDQCGLISRVRVELITDSYPFETSWEITEDDTVVMSGGQYIEKHHNYSDTQCFDYGSFRFTIYDSYGDGICCSEGK